MSGTFVPLFYSKLIVALQCIIWPAEDEFHSYPHQILIPNPYAWLKLYNKVFNLSICATFLMILVSVSYMYAKILVTLRKRKRSTNLQMSAEFKKHIKQVSVMVIVNGSVFLFWMSISLLFPISLVLFDDPVSLLYWQIVPFSSYDINASINPLIYFLTNERYRYAVKTLLRGCFRF